MEQKNGSSFAVKKTKLFIAAKGNKLTFYLILSTEDLDYTQKVVLLKFQETEQWGTK